MWTAADGLVKKIFQLVHERFGAGIVRSVVACALLVKVPQQLLLPLSQLNRGFNHHMAHQIALCRAA